MYAEIARYLGSDFPGDVFRHVAGVIQIKDVIRGRTYLNGLLHSFEGRPARVDGAWYWYQHGELHRDNDQPAVVRNSGDQKWYQHGEIHRDGDQPAIVYASGTRHWYQRDKLHRDGDQPAVVCIGGDREWYQLGKLHRDGDQPALITANGDQKWYQHGKRVEHVVFSNFKV